MKVKFLGFKDKYVDIEESWFTIGKTYVVIKDNSKAGHVWVINDFGDEDPYI